MSVCLSNVQKAIPLMRKNAQMFMPWLQSSTQQCSLAFYSTKLNFWKSLLSHSHYLKHSSLASDQYKQNGDDVVFPSLSERKETFLSLCYLSANFSLLKICIENRQNCFF